MRVMKTGPIQLLTFGLVQVLVLTALVSSAHAQSKPNVVFILADDLGWSDTTLYGMTQFYRTPNIERLAARGMTFTRAYSSSPLCSPTRASIMTGLSPARTGITSPNCHLAKVVLEATTVASAAPHQKATIPDSVTRLDTRYYTLAEMFQDNGYATGHFGKWHLGAEPYSPLQHGFDADLPHHHGPGPAGSYVAPWRFQNFDHDPDVPNQHIEDRMAEEAVTFMEQHRHEPFFLNYWMFSVHAPFDAKQELIDQYRARVDPDDPQRSPTYAAMIESMDDAVGTLLDALDRLEIADRTIIVFHSDNGGNKYSEVDGTTATSNAPLRGGKATMYEGGIRVPTIVVCPDLVEAGSWSDEVIQSGDFYPTLLELLAIEPMDNQQFDGISIVPALRQQPLDREAIFTYFPHNPRIPDWLPPSVSVHSGDWKLIRIFQGGEGGRHRYKLFNLADDLEEQNDLAANMPDRVRELDALIEEFLVETGAVLPLPNPDFDPSRYQLELEGVAELKPTRPTSPSAEVPVDSVAGWRARGTCTLALHEGTLIVTSTGGDPHLSSELPGPMTEETLILEITMSSRSAGSGRVYWQERDVAPVFHRDRSMPFEVQHDGETHDYAVSLRPTNAVVAVRIDPSTAPGDVIISQLRLTTTDGHELHRWEFTE